jgi:antitoxin HicB
MRYPVTMEKIEDEYVASISHPNGRFQGVCSGATKQEALKQAQKLIAIMVTAAMKNAEPIELPSTCVTGNMWVSLPPMLAAKAALYIEMRKQGTRKADLARALGMDYQKQVDRILDPAHRSTLPQLEAAAIALGKQLEIRLV